MKPTLLGWILVAVAGCGSNSAPPLSLAEPLRLSVTGAAGGLAGIAEHLRHRGPEDVGVEETDRSIFHRLEDLPGDPDQDNPTITVDGLQYKVRFRQRDGLGGIRLFLYRVA